MELRVIFMFLLLWQLLCLAAACGFSLSIMLVRYIMWLLRRRRILFSDHRITVFDGNFTPDRDASMRRDKSMHRDKSMRRQRCVICYRRADAGEALCKRCRSFAL